MANRAAPELVYPFLNRVEACKLRAYQDSKGVWTIGIGHTGPEVHKGLVIPQVRADEYLRADVVSAINRLYRVVKAEVIADLNVHQHAALISFVFNLGANPSWGFWKVVNARKFDEVPAYMMRFNKVVENGKARALPGLTARRAEEVRLWSTCDAEDKISVTSSVIREAETPPAAQPDAKPLVSSKTMWTGAATAAAGAAQGAATLQNMASPQAGNSELIAKIVGFCAVAIVALGVAVMVFRFLDERAKRK